MVAFIPGKDLPTPCRPSWRRLLDLIHNVEVTERRDDETSDTPNPDDEPDPC